MEKHISDLVLVSELVPNLKAKKSYKKHLVGKSFKFSALNLYNKQNIEILDVQGALPHFF